MLFNKFVERNMAYGVVMRIRQQMLSEGLLGVNNYSQAMIQSSN